MLISPPLLFAPLLPRRFQLSRRVIVVLGQAERHVRAEPRPDGGGA
jgi:hypothetical protein